MRPLKTSHYGTMNKNVIRCTKLAVVHRGCLCVVNTYCELFPAHPILESRDLREFYIDRKGDLFGPQSGDVMYLKIVTKKIGHQSGT